MIMKSWGRYGKLYVIQNINVIDKEESDMLINSKITKKAVGAVIAAAMAVSMIPATLLAAGIQGDAESGYYALVPKTGEDTVSLSPDGVSTLSVYDHGGPNGNYDNGCNGNLVINAPEGYRIKLSGSYTLESPSHYNYHTYIFDYFVLNGGSNKYTDTGSLSDYTSESNTLSIRFVSDGSYTYAGFALTATLVPYNVITTAPTASAITYGQTLADSTLTGGEAYVNGSSDVEGTFAWSNPDTMPTIADSGVTPYEVTFTPNDSSLPTLTCSVTLTVTTPAGVDEVIAMIEALPAPDDVTTADESAITAAQQALAALPEDQQALVPEELKTKLNDCDHALQVALIAELKDALSGLLDVVDEFGEEYYDLLPEDIGNDLIDSFSSATDVLLNENSTLDEVEAAFDELFDAYVAAIDYIDGIEPEEEESEEEVVEEPVLTPEQIQELAVRHFVERLYLNALDRPFDVAGRDSFVDLIMHQNGTGSDVVRDFLGSVEFANRNLNNEEFVNVLYKAFFNRVPTASEAATWTNALASGMTRAEIIEAFIASPEWAEVCAYYKINI